MNKRSTLIGYGLLGLFVLSGFSGLIYQAIWSHYLGLTLGHAAYAQTLVLSIFMGGMAIGAAIASRYTLQIRHLILAYAIIELLIGLAGLVFHPTFLWYTQISQETVLPALRSGSSAALYQWLSATGLILPQCILLGATFPLLSAGYLRFTPADDARVLGGLYFSNSIGAAVGALVATFMLLPAIGMPGAMATAGWVNIIVGLGAIVVWRMTLGESAEQNTSKAASGSEKTTAPLASATLFRLVIASTFLSGAFSFVYEIGWIRLLNQALGTTLHSFELMLAAFIAGLAFGGLWIRNRAERIQSAIRYAAVAQILMGVAALMSVIVFAHSFSWVSWMLEAFQRNDQGYDLFILGSAVISLLVMFPAAFFAGMTLPLFTMALLRGHHGERSIGRVYAANTLGSIAGVLLAVHILIPIMGVHLAVMMAAVGDIAIGLLLALHASAGLKAWAPIRLVGALTLIAIIGLSFVAGKPDPLQQVAGVFRTGIDSLPEGTVVAFLKDGKTATVSVYADQTGAYGVISTNGKPDASLSIHDDETPLPDEITMAMVASLPLAIHPQPDRVAVIGWGSGLTTHTFLGSPAVQTLESIEIEREMWHGARLFGERVGRAYSDPRSRVIFDDARTWFSTGSKQYDVIISEPSNPWVSGVGSLFTVEFYEFLSKHLAEGGLLVQWMQTYEISDRLLSQMTAALISVFPNVDVYTTNGGDLLFVSSASRISTFMPTRLEHEPLKTELRRVGLASEADYQIRYLGDRNMLAAYQSLYGAVEHSDFHPTVSLQAPRDRFARRTATVLERVYTSPIPVMQILGKDRPIPANDIVQSAPNTVPSRNDATLIVEGLRSSRHDGSDDLRIRSLLETAIPRPDTEVSDLTWTSAIAELAAASINHFPADDLIEAWIEPVWIDEDLGTPVMWDVLGAYEAIAMRDTALASERAEQVLQAHGPRLAPKMREQLLVAGLVHAASLRDDVLARSWENEFGTDSARELLPIRSFLLAWADSRPGET